MIRVTLVRHGESTSNVQRRWQGHGDAPLSERGRTQVRRVGARLRDARFDRVIASDLQRAADTAWAIAPDQVELDPSWREVDLGRWEGLTPEEVAARYPDELAALQRGEDVKLGGAESWADLRDRVHAALAGLVDAVSDGASVLVVAHGGVIHSLTSALTGAWLHRPRPFGRIDNTAVTTLHVDRGTTGGIGSVRLARLNDTVHLAPLGDWAHEQRAAGARLSSFIAHEAGLAAPDALDTAYASNGDEISVAPAAFSRWIGVRVGLPEAFEPLTRGRRARLVRTVTGHMALADWNAG